MKRLLIVSALICFVLISATVAEEWKSRIGFGVRGPLFAPMIKGDNMANEPFMMGLGADAELKFGVTNNLVIGLSGGYWSTYDDALATEDQSFKLNKKDNATFKYTAIPIGLTGQYYFMSESDVQPFLLGGLSMNLGKYESQGAGAESYSVSDLNLKLGAGINFWISESFAFDISGRFSYLLTNMSADELPDGAAWGFDDAANRPFIAVLEPGIGLTYFISGAKDTDKDGVKDKFDQCSDTPKGALVDEYGCPLDNDGDGVFDGIDICPATPKGAYVDISGCALDSDKDGVPDGIDVCQDTPLEVEVDAYGCPLDNDNDGIPDFKDQQLDTPAGAIVDENGVALDVDLDGVPNGIDKCPNTPAGVQTDEFGCPLAKPINEKIILNIQYASGSAEPDDDAKLILDDIAHRMMIYSEAKLEINGYTDALGSSRSNFKLSENRAKAVSQYLIDKGVDASRLTAQGFGEEEKYFIAPNDTAEGRQKNRRVELVPIN